VFPVRFMHAISFTFHTYTPWIICGSHVSPHSLSPPSFGFDGLPGRAGRMLASGEHSPVCLQSSYCAPISAMCTIKRTLRLRVLVPNIFLDMPTFHIRNDLHHVQCTFCTVSNVVEVGFNKYAGGVADCKECTVRGVTQVDDGRKR
jgi:hypothetical protein